MTNYTKYIYLTRGIQGSGKSTWAEKWVKEDPENRIRLNWDSLRNMFGQYWVPKRENLSVINDMTIAFLKSPMEHGWDIVVDNMNLNPKGWKFFQDIIDTYNKENTNFNYELKFKDFFDITLEECITRDSFRANPIGENVIRQTYKKYRKFMADELNKAAVNNKKQFDPNKRDCILVDMDATLCFNTSGRPFYGEGCAEGIKDDVPCEEICSLVNTYIKNPDVDVIILTGREDTPEIRKATAQWLKDYLCGSVDKIIMRPAQCYYKGQDCKKMLYNDYIKPYYNVLFVLEDSTKVVKMWREQGIMCLQVNDGFM